MSFYFIRDNTLVSASQPPAGAQPIAQLGETLLPPIVTELHHSLHAWGKLGKRPGLLTADRTWATTEGTLVVSFAEGETPYPLLHIGMAREIATWLVLLDKWMETFVVIARARTVWTSHELAGAMTFVNSAYLPKSLVIQSPNNWKRVAQALALVVADKPLEGETKNRHWEKQMAT